MGGHPRVCKKDQRIIALQNEKNLGISPTRNKLIALAKGKYIVWQDADDISMPYRIEHQYAFMESHPEVGICGGYLQFFSEKGLGGIRKYAPDDASLRRTIFRYSPVAQPAAMARAECIVDSGPFDKGLSSAEDLDMAFRIGQRHEFANLQEVVLEYRQNMKGSTCGNLRAMELNTLKVRRRYHEKSAYSLSFLDKVYNFIQLLGVFSLPSGFRMTLFSKFRDSKA